MRDVSWSGDGGRKHVGRCFGKMIWIGYVSYLLMNSNQQQTG